MIEAETSGLMNVIVKTILNIDVFTTFHFLVLTLFIRACYKNDRVNHKKSNLRLQNAYRHQNN